MTLTEEELAEARTHLELIQAIKKDMSERVAYAHSAEFKVERTDIEQLAYMIITKCIGDTLETQVAALAEKLGVDPSDTTEERLAEVIQLFDGNRRITRLP